VQSRIDDVFARFPDLEAWRRKRAGDLSGGQRTMLECAKVNIVHPEILIVDEPSVGLAPKVALQIYDQIAEFHNKGMSLFLIDHNVRKVIDLSSYIYVMNMGQITSQGWRSTFEGELTEQVQKWLGL